MLSSAGLGTPTYAVGAALWGDAEAVQGGHWGRVATAISGPRRSSSLRGPSRKSVEMVAGPRRAILRSWRAIGALPWLPRGDSLPRRMVDNVTASWVQCWIAEGVWK